MKNHFQTKVVLILSLLFILGTSVPMSVLASIPNTSGILRGVQPTSTTGSGTWSYATDGIITNSIPLKPNNGNSLVYHLDTPKNIRTLYVAGSGYVRLSVRNNAGVYLFDYYVNNFNIPVAVNWDNVQDITLYNPTTGSAYLNEIDMYTTDKAPPAEVTSLAYNISTRYLSWIAPTDSDLNSYQIYVNGVLKSTVAKSATQYQVKATDLGTGYNTFIVKTVDTNNNISDGVSVTVSIDSKPVGYLQGVVPTIVQGQGKDLSNITDHNLSTAGGIFTRNQNGSPTIFRFNLSAPRTINSAFLKFSGCGYSAYPIAFYNSSNELLANYEVICGSDSRTKKIIQNNGYTMLQAPIPNVSYVLFYNYVGLSYTFIDFTEFDVFGDISLPGVPIGLSGTPGLTNVNLTWNAVSDINPVKYYVYKNGVYIAAVDKSNTTFNVTSLLSGTSYDFQVSAVDTDGIEYAKSSVYRASTLTQEASSNADLSSLSVSQGSLNPVFSSDTLSYMVDVANDVTNISITPTVADSTATVEVNGVVVTSGQASEAIPLNVGLNEISIVSTAEDGTTKTYTINITRAVLAGATFEANLTTPTNSDVTVTITYPADATVKEYKIGNSSWTAYTGPVVLTANDTIYARYQDAYGNVSAETSYVVSNIDKIAPEGATFVANITAPTNTDINVTINYPSDAAIKEYKIGSGLWTAYTVPVVLSGNDTVYARSRDDVGNVSAETSYVVSNIDKIAPEDATFVANTIVPTNSDVTVTINYPSDAVVKEYKIGSGSWTAYSAPVVISANDTVYARSQDAAGNVSATTSYDVSNIDKIAPEGATIAADITVRTNSNVTLTITYPSDAAVKEYKIGNGSWTLYTIPIVLSANDTVYARSQDAAGNVSITTSYVVSNINHPPVWNPIGDQTVNEGEQLQFVVSASDPEGDMITYGASGLPTGATFNPDTRIFSWTPGYSQSGLYPNITFTASDGSLTTPITIQINVNDISPADLINLLKGMITNLDLPNKTMKNLLSTLGNALDKIDKGNNNAAEQQLYSLIKDVEKERGVTITDGQADEIISKIQVIISVINQ
jgi:hypothetical protein